MRGFLIKCNSFHELRLSIWRKYWPDLACLLFLIVLDVVFFARVLASGDILYGRDTGYFYANWDFVQHTVRSGAFPLWNPYVFSGHPFIANTQTALFYPPSVLFYFLPLNWAFNLNYILHVFLAGAFTFLLSRSYGLRRGSSIASAVTFMFAGFMISRIWAGHLGFYNGMVWIPLAMFTCRKAVERRNIIFAIFTGLILAFQFLAGHIAIPAYTLVLLTLYTLGVMIGPLRRKRDVRVTAKAVPLFAAVVVSFGLFSAVQLIPAIEAYWLSNRAEASYQFLTSFSLPWYGFVMFLMPRFFGDPLLQTPKGIFQYYHEVCPYVGLLPLILVSIAFVRRRVDTKFYFIVLMLSLLLALGANTPLYVLVSSLPGFDILRAPSRFLLLATFSLAVLAGFGLDYVVGRSALAVEHVNARIGKFDRLLVLLFGVVAVIGVVLVGAGTLARDYVVSAVQAAARLFMHSPSDPYGFLSFMLSDMPRNFLSSGINLLWTLPALAAMITRDWWASRRVWAAAVELLVLGTLLLDLWSFDSIFIQSDPNIESRLLPEKEVLEFLAQDKDIYRTWFVRGETEFNTAGFPNSGLLTGVPGVEGYDPIVLSRYEEFSNAVAGRPIHFSDPGLTGVDLGDHYSPLLNLLNVKYIISDKSFYEPALSLVMTTPNHAKVWENQGFLPKVFMVQDYVVTNPQEGLGVLQRISGDYERLAVLEGDPECHNVHTDTSAVKQIVVLSPRGKSPNETEFDVKFDNRALLFISEAFYPGWTAYVDGHPSRIFVANHSFMALCVDAGKHHIQLRFAPLSFEVGAAVSLVSICAFFAGTLIWHYRQDSTRAALSHD